MSIRGLIALLREPEVQFFIIFTIPFVGFFLINYNNVPDVARLLVVILFVAIMCIVLFQTVYSVSAHRRLKEEENSFISATVHQLRTPLTAVKWVLEELGKREVRDNERVELTRMADVAACRVSNIIDSFNELSKIQGGHTVYTFQRVDLLEFIDQCVREAEPVAKQYGVGLFLEKGSEPIEIEADPVKLEIVVSNLINNAIKYNHKGGMVTLRARPLTADHVVEVVIEDTGMGIAPAELKHIFEKYYRTEQAKRVNTSGSGLGLYLVKTIVEQHEGRVWVNSIQGKGSAFHFTLPLAKG